MLAVKQCRFCSKDFEHVRGWKLGSLCSDACSTKHYRRRAHPERFSVRKCVACQSEFMPSLKNTTKQRCCSIECGKRDYYLRNKEQEDSRRLEWARNNRPKQLSYAIASRDKRPEHYRELKRIAEERRRARLFGCSGSYTAEEWQAIKAKYGNRCLCCGRLEGEVEITADHVVPLSAGGENSASNLQPLCRQCNCSKFTQFIEYRPDHLLAA